MKAFLQKAWKVFLVFLVISFGSSILFVIAYRFINPPVTPLMIIRLAEQAFDNQPLRLKKDWVPLSEISSDMELAVIASEDNLFTEHHGFDMDAIEKAKLYNEKKRGKKVRGCQYHITANCEECFSLATKVLGQKGAGSIFYSAD